MEQRRLGISHPIGADHSTELEQKNSIINDLERRVFSLESQVRSLSLREKRLQLEMDQMAKRMLEMEVKMSRFLTSPNPNYNAGLDDPKTGNKKVGGSLGKAMGRNFLTSANPNLSVDRPVSASPPTSYIHPKPSASVHEEDADEENIKKGKKLISLDRVAEKMGKLFTPSSSPNSSHINNNNPQTISKDSSGGNIHQSSNSQNPNTSSISCPTPLSISSPLEEKNSSKSSKKNISKSQAIEKKVVQPEKRGKKPSSAVYEGDRVGKRLLSYPLNSTDKAQIISLSGHNEKTEEKPGHADLLARPSDSTSPPPERLAHSDKPHSDAVHPVSVPPEQKKNDRLEELRKYKMALQSGQGDSFLGTFDAYSDDESNDSDLSDNDDDDINSSPTKNTDNDSNNENSENFKQKHDHLNLNKVATTSVTPFQSNEYPLQSKKRFYNNIMISNLANNGNNNKNNGKANVQETVAGSEKIINNIENTQKQNLIYHSNNVYSGFNSGLMISPSSSASLSRYDTQMLPISDSLLSSDDSVLTEKQQTPRLDPKEAQKAFMNRRSFLKRSVSDGMINLQQQIEGEIGQLFPVFEMGFTDDHVICEIGNEKNIYITYGDLATLQPNKVISPRIVDYFFAQLSRLSRGQGHLRAVKILPSEFYSKLTEPTYNYSAVSNLTIHADFNLLLVPVLLPNDHWILAVISYVSHKDHILLTIHDSKEEYARQRCARVIRFLRRWIEDEASQKHRKLWPRFSPTIKDVVKCHPAEEEIKDLLLHDPFLTDHIKDSALFVCEFARKVVYREDGEVTCSHLRKQYIHHFVCEGQMQLHIPLFGRSSINSSGGSSLANSSNNGNSLNDSTHSASLSDEIEKVSQAVQEGASPLRTQTTADCHGRRGSAIVTKLDKRRESHHDSVLQRVKTRLQANNHRFRSGTTGDVPSATKSPVLSSDAAKSLSDSPKSDAAKSETSSKSDKKESKLKNAM